MKSGLGDRNNVVHIIRGDPPQNVSMKSGLGDRNNTAGRLRTPVPRWNASQ